MSKNTGKGNRKDAVTKRTQTYNPKTEKYVKRNTEIGQFMGVKQEGEKLKGAA